MDKKFRSGYITIIGRPNVGKSTLMNLLAGEKLSIVSDKPQTTRNRIQTVLTGDDYQIVFMDTPGIHKAKNRLDEYMVATAENTLRDGDLSLFMTTPDGEIGPGDRFIIDMLKGTKSRSMLIINKIDKSRSDAIAMTIKKFSDQYDFCDIVPVSALTGKNTDELLRAIVANLPEGPKYYPDDAITDVSEKFIVSEIIREKALNSLRQEVPHGIAVEVLGMKAPKTGGKIEIDANIYCEKESHKGIIIGREGSMLKHIKSYARPDIERFLGSRVKLNLWVKVKSGWRDKANLLKDFGYK